MTVDAKKRYLRRYKRHERRMNRIQAEIEEIRMLKMCPASGRSGTIHGTTQRDLSDYAADLESLEEQLYQEYVERIKDYKEISYRISQLKDERERDTLFYIYIKGLNAWQTGQQIGYSESRVYRFLKRGLEKIEINDQNDSEKQ